MNEGVSREKMSTDETIPCRSPEDVSKAAQKAIEQANSSGQDVRIEIHDDIWFFKNIIHWSIKCVLVIFVF